MVATYRIRNLRRAFTLLLSLSLSQSLFSQSIEEKKRSFSTSTSSSSELGEQAQLLDIQTQLNLVYEEAMKLHEQKAAASLYEPLYLQARTLHTKWQELARHMTKSAVANESEAVWHLPDSTVKQLVMEFGGAEAIYLIPDEVAQRKVSVVSSLSLPRQSWSGMLELILSEMGIGVRQVNPFCKELFFSGLSEGFERITDQRDELWLLPDQQRVCLVLGSGPVDVKHFARTLSRLVDPLSVQIKPLGTQLAIVAPALRLRQLMQIYDFMARTEQTKAYRIVSLSRLSAIDLQKMLSVVFAQSSENAPTVKSDLDQIGLQIFPIQYDQQSALFIAGSEGEVKRAVDLIGELESQIEVSNGKRLFWYSAKHANAEDLAKVVSKVYRLLVESNSGEASESAESQLATDSPSMRVGNISPLVITPSPVGYNNFDKKVSSVEEEGQIVVDAKSGALIMVVEPAVLPKLKELIARLDTPKKMVRVDFLLFEKRITDQMQFGLEQLAVGSGASGLARSGMAYSVGALSGTGLAAPVANVSKNGIMHYFASHSGNQRAPAFDLAYNFLLSQDSVQINANPSILTLNGTPSVVNLVDEISLNVGPTSWLDGSGKTATQNSYMRAQYGITIKLTPTIHQLSDVDSSRSVTLETDINFDTPSSLTDDKPTVTRRNIKNLVRVSDGQTIVLGGLRQKQTEDTQNALPFLGEIPGLGKLFSYNSTFDFTKEMFIFITPHIIDDPQEDEEKLQLIEFKRRPGDLNEFLISYEQSQEQRRCNLFNKTLRTLMGREIELGTGTVREHERGEYDGR